MDTNSAPTNTNAAPNTTSTKTSAPKLLYSSIASTPTDTSTSDRPQYALQVFRKDRGPTTRTDQYRIQFGVAEGMRLAVEGGQKGRCVAHNGTKKGNRYISVFVYEESAQFYKKLIQDLGKVYLPGEIVPGKII